MNASERGKADIMNIEVSRAAMNVSGCKHRSRIGHKYENYFKMM